MENQPEAAALIPASPKGPFLFHCTESAALFPFGFHKPHGALGSRARPSRPYGWLSGAAQ